MALIERFVQGVPCLFPKIAGTGSGAHTTECRISGDQKWMDGWIIQWILFTTLLDFCCVCHLGVHNVRLNNKYDWTWIFPWINLVIISTPFLHYIPTLATSLYIRILYSMFCETGRGHFKCYLYVSSRLFVLLLNMVASTHCYRLYLHMQLTWTWD